MIINNWIGAVIKADGKVVKSKTDNNIVEIQDMIVLAS